MNKISLNLLLLFFFTGLFAQGQLTLDHITDGTFRQRSVRSVNWMNDGRYYTALSENQVIQYDVTTGEQVDILVDGDALNIQIDGYEFNADENKVLLLTDRQSIYRRSFTGVYYVHELGGNEITGLSEGRQSYATFSPDGSKVAFTRNNNLYYVDLGSNQEYMVTDDGKFNFVINGSTDWVYEEELYLTKAFTWNADGTKIAFYRFDESNVREYHLQKWNNGALYPEDYVYKYPKAGEINSIVEILVYDLSSTNKTSVDIGSETDIYIPRIYWTKDRNLLSVQRLNRLQNRLDILHVNTSNGDSKVVLTDQSDTYIDFTFCDDLTYLENGEQFLFSSEKSGYKHFYLYNLDGSLVRQVTSGDYEAVSLVGLDQSPRTPILYYTSTEDSPLERHLFKVDLRGRGKQRLTEGEGNVSIDMSEDCQYYQNYQSRNEKALVVALFRTEKNQKIKDLESNEELNGNIDRYGLVTKEFFKVTLEDGTFLDGYFLKPASFNATSKYPVLMFQYSGPGSQQVANRWGGSHYIWHQYLAQQGYIIAVVDGRGTGYKGEAFKKMTYGNLGYYEVEDQITTAKYLAQLPYVNEERIGIWGWSYGGYMSSLCMMKGADIFKTGIAVAPVTNWRYYDTIYTERYQGLPQDNPSGYDDNSPSSHVEKLKGNFLLIHGTGDDNVHFQNSVALQNALINAGKQFESFYYPDKTHGIGGVRKHLYEMMTSFILENL